MAALSSVAGPVASGKHARPRAVNYARVSGVHQAVIERVAHQLGTCGAAELVLDV